ncbi:MAG: glucoamylase family protein [Gemmatimonadota bacterium]
MDESAPGSVRELYGTAKLAQHARELAQQQELTQQHRGTARETRRGLLLSRLNETEKVLADVREVLLEASAQDIDVPPAGAWLLDAYFLVLEHGREIRANLPTGYYQQLPKLASGPYRGFPRVYGIALELVSHVEGQLDRENIELMIREYQTVEPLTLGELWAWPVMLRIALLESVRRTALRTKRDVLDAMRADEQVRRFRSVPGGDAALRRELAAFVEHPPEMTAAFLTRFFQQIRAARADFTALLWVEQWIAEDAMTAEEAVQRSTRRQSLTQLVMANSITSLRTISSFAWPEFVEEMSVTDAVLRDDPATYYSRMTFESRDRYRHAVEELAKRAKTTERTVAHAAIALAAQAAEPRDGVDRRDRVTHVGYYLIGRGRPLLERALSYRPTLARGIARFAKRHVAPFYFGALAATTIAVLAAVLAPLPSTASLAMRVIAVLLAFVPASEIGIALINQLTTILVPPSRLPRLDCLTHGVSTTHRTIVVVPLLLDSAEAAREALDHLETQFLANRDDEIRFALLADFPDAPSESLATDAAIVDAAIAGVRALNLDYSESSPFYLFQRPRRKNEREGAWMGWERKRGKLEEFNAYIAGRERNAFSHIEGDRSWLSGVRYVITLDADSLLPRGAAAALIGTIAHPLNRAVFPDGGSRAIEGYGILQPRVSVTLQSANRSRFASIFADQPGVDPYTTAVSDVYQDLFGEGSYTGKGIYDIAAFERATVGRFPPNALLSHDLIEGAFARAGLVTDVEIFDDYPSRYLTAAARQERWTRGDWQLLPFIFSRGQRADGLSLLSRWKMLDNLRRSLVPIAMLAWIVAGWTVLPGSPASWTMVALIVFAMRWMLAPLLAAIRPPRRQSWIPYYHALRGDAAVAAEQATLFAVLLPHQALATTVAIGRALVRTFITHRRMLEWTTSSQAERVVLRQGTSRWSAMLPATVVGLALAAWGAAAAPIVLVIPFALCWALAPYIVLRISEPAARTDLALTPAQRANILRYSERHWRYFDHFVGESTRWLVPDNFQATPSPVVADRTSPTNIGLQLLSIVSAFDLGFLDRGTMIERVERAFGTMASMRRLRGHFYNWYRLSDLGVLEPPYISTVDSGNLAGHLIALAAACTEIAERAHDKPADASRLAALAERARTMALEMDFTLLFDHERNLFAIGFDERANRLDASSYDLLASEARLTSFFAIAKGDAPRDHWFRLGRSLTSHAGATALVSWSGSMFEYLMPLLVMPSSPHSLLDQTHCAAVTRQIAYGRARQVPWGISESAYNVRDRHDTYQYRAFGVPDLALKRGLASELVVAPYATALALTTDPHEALVNLMRLEREGALGEYGFHDALDYTRPAPDGARAIVEASMAHHVGMSLVAMDNALHVVDGDGIWQRRFMADPLCRAARLLLDERVPRRYIARAAQPDAPEISSALMPAPQPVVREFDSAHTAEPRVGLLGDVPYCVLVTNAGSGYSRSNGIAVTRWRADATRDDTGQWIYVKDLHDNRVWSSAYQPTGVTPDGYRVAFATDRVVFRRRDGDIETRTDIIVVARDRAEVRVVAVTNRSRYTREVELTSYGEVVLTDPDADRAHPAFQNLFVQTEWLPEGIVLASRRPRSTKEQTLWCAHVVATGPECVSPVTCETDRARFIGRGRSARVPRALDDGATLSGSVGAVLDPIMALRVRIRLAPGRTGCVAFTTLVADNRDEARDVADRYRDLRATDRALSLSWTSAQVELRSLGVPPTDAALYQVLAGALLYPNEQLRASAQSRAENRRGQHALWGQGISGDWPVVLATISDAVGLPSVEQLLIAHKYWRMKGVTADLVIINDKDHSYVQDLHDQILSMVRSSSEGGVIDRPGGVFVRRADTMTAEDVALVRTTARVTVICDGVGLGNIVDHAALGVPLAPMEEWGLIDRVRRDLRARKDDAVPAKTEDASPPKKRASSSARGDYANGLGRLTGAGVYEMRIAGAHLPPAPWSNIIANPNAGFCVTERGGGFTWTENSYFYRLTPWHNDPVCDPPGEVLYLRDDATGEVWTPTPAPSPAIDAPAGDDAAAAYGVSHEAGRTIFTHERNGIASTLSLGVPASDPVKIAILQLSNLGNTSRRVSVTSYVELALGAQREHTRHQLHTWRDEGTGAVFAENYFTDDFASRVAFSWVSAPVEGFTANREEFIGRNGDLVSPAGAAAKKLSGTTGAGFDPCAAIRSALTIAPGETAEIVVLLGAAGSQDEARAIIGRHSTVADAREAVDAAVRAWETRLTMISARTPSPEFDAMLNRWSLYQALSCRMWARSALYQSSGAYGFRDQLQDCMAFAYAEPAIARAHLVRCAGRQFVEGDVQHWWHEPGGRGVRTRFSDDLVWLPFVADHYVTVTGDASIWDELAPFLEQSPLAPGEQEAYEEPHVSATTATLYQHCVRALDRACTSGSHGLPLMGCGDWNDGMNRVGIDGNGESVWLAWFLIAALRRFADHATARGDAATADRCRSRAEAYASAVEQTSWDGAWYRRAYFDDGTPLGSEQSDECRIDSIAQSWATLSGAGQPDRARRAMESVGEKLVREDARLITLLAPPFDHSAHDPGYIKGYLPGVRENGAQYTHAAAWVALATARLGDGERAVHLLNMLNPLTHAATEAGVATYKVEPYVVCADVYTAPGHVGRGGWTWYTGSASWMYRAALEGVLGFTKRGNSLRIEPCVPSSWRDFEIEYRHGTSTYVIGVRNPDGVQTGIANVQVDGREIDDGVVTLADDGRRHEVIVTMGVRARSVVAPLPA